ncbi:MAG: ferritin family protein [Candidatus Aminicenantales bacterium]
MLEIQTASVEELLGYAVRSEIDSNKAYKDLAESVSNPLLKQKFQWLAFEEQKHREILEKLYGSLFPGKELQIPDQPSQELLKRIEITPSSSLLDILLQAMESEKSAENFYARMAERMEGTAKKLLEYLSKVERSHYLMLKSEYDAVQDFEDYAEKDIDKIVT